MAFQSLRSFGAAAVAVTKQAAVAVADVTVKTYNDLQAVPDTIKCAGPNCVLQVAVPPNIFDWACGTAACEVKGIRHDRSKKVCDACNQPKPPQHDRTVVCAACGHPTIVPTSNASKHARGAGQAVKGVAVAVKDGAVSTYKEMKATPSTIPCSGCSTILEVPINLFDYTCEKADCLKRNPSSAITCEQCGTAKPKSASDAVHAVTCQVCQSKTVVPNSNASKHLSSAAKATKEFARSVSTSTKSAYAHAKASPVQFNVPGYWVCKGCQSQNPREPQVEGGEAKQDDAAAAAAAQTPTPSPARVSDAAISPSSPSVVPSSSSTSGDDASASVALVGRAEGASSDDLKRDEKKKLSDKEKAAAANHCPICGFERDEVEMVQCGTCRQPTPVPRSNFGNSFKKTTTDLTRSISKLWFDVSSTPYISCDQCHATIKVPAAAPSAIGGAAPARGSAPSVGNAPAAGTPVHVTCQSCNKTFTATVGAAPGSGAAAPGGAPAPAATVTPSPSVR